MNFLLVGDGNAREHCTFHMLNQNLSKNERLFFAITGNNGLLADYDNVFLIQKIFDGLNLARQLNIDLIIILSPHQLMDGAFDLFSNAGFAVFGVSQATSELESNKVMGKNFMNKYGIPTPSWQYFTDNTKALHFLKKNWKDNEREFVIKSNNFLVNANYRALMPSSLKEAEHMVNYLMHNGDIRNQSETILIEEKLLGQEISLHVLYDGNDYKILPFVCDYKRLFENDEGPNTHGMGAISATETLHSPLIKKIEKEIVCPTLNGLNTEKTDFKYILYIGLIKTKNGIQVLEYNVRPGNPEWIALLNLIDMPLAEIICAIQNKKLNNITLRWHENCYAGVVFATSAGYPFINGRTYNEKITGLEKIDSNLMLLGENLSYKNNHYWTEGGRVFAICGKSHSLDKLHSSLYKNIEKVNYTGMFYRQDIAKNSNYFSQLESC